MPQLALYLLGLPRIELNGIPLQLERRKALALLVYLTLNPQAHSRDALATLFWPGYDQTYARANLRRTLSTLNQAMDSAWLEIERERVALPQSDEIWVDVNHFRHLLASCAAHGHPLTEVCPVCLAPLGEAVVLYHDDFLTGFTLADSPDFDDWQLFQAEALRHELAEALERLVQGHAAQGEYKPALTYARRWLALNPLHEPAQRRLMALHAQAGDRVGALLQYQECARVFQQELGVLPSTETTALYERIRQGVEEPQPGGTSLKHASSQEPKEMEGQGNRGETSLLLPSFLSAIPVPPPPLTPFVAREQELAQLNMVLQEALRGQGRVVFVTGEAGSGKTTLSEEFGRRAQLAQPGLIVLNGICNAFTGSGDPYLPFREILALLSGDLEHRWTAGALSRDQAMRLWQLMPLTIETLVNEAPDLINVLVSGSALAARASEATLAKPTWLADLNALLAKKATGPLNTQQASLFEQYSRVLKRLAQQQPLLLVVDDLQWADAGSISLLFHLGRQLAGSRILVVGMYRPADVASTGEGERHPLRPVINEFKRTFGDTQLHLGQTEGQTFVEALLDTEPNYLDESFRAALYRQTRGHPLFTLEILRAMQERGDLAQDDKGYWIEGTRIDWERLPARVEGVIEERLGRLPVRLQEALKVASIEGEVFTAEAVAQIQAVDARDLVRQLSGELDQRHHLVKEQGFLRLNVRRLSQYMFRHNLFQKYLYNSLGASERAYLHESVGRTLEALYGDQKEEIAVQLAWHFQEGGIVEKATDYLRLAGKQALQLSANAEAIAHLTQGLELLKTQLVTSEHIQQELNMRLALGVAVTATKGYGSPEAEKVYLRAQELGQQVGKISQLFPALYGLWRCWGVQGQWPKAQTLAEQLLQLAQTTQEHALLLEAHRAMGVTLFHQGEAVSAQGHLDQSIALYDARQHRAHAFLYGHDPGVSCFNYAAINLWLLGYPDQSLARSREIFQLVQEELAHPFSLAYTLAMGSWPYVFRREIQVTRERAETAITLSTKQVFPMWLNVGLTLRGWALAGQGEAERGVSQIRQGLEALLATSTEMFHPQILALLAEAYKEAGQIEAALVTLDEALAVVEKTGESWWNAELYRLKGELLLQSQTTPRAEVEAYFRQAIEIARQQSARSLELRAVMSLSRLWQRQGRRGEARQLLAEIYGWFTEGFDTADLQEARTLLEELGGE